MTAARASTRRLIVGAVAAIMLLGGAGVALYVAAKPDGNSGCAADAALLARLRPLAKGEVAALAVPDAPRRLPPLSFKGTSGEPMALEDLKGRTILLNLWATWCVPCRLEMPALDRLQGEMGGPDFAVAAVNMDTRNLERPRAWLGEVGIRNLAYYADPETQVFRALKEEGRMQGLPTSILIDRGGCEIATLDGPAEWAGADARAFIAAALGR